MNTRFKGDLKEEIFNAVNENVKALERLFPSVVKDGQVDFQALKEELGQFEEVGPEKYGLTWSGKQNAKKIAQQDISGKTLKYIPEDSKNPDTTENLYIEGDNLEVLKLLRQNYYGAIKMIYIDPPYNTGNDFVYNDNFSMDKGQSDIEEGNISELGERYTVNSKSSNKYHANWLNMMYPRLKVAKDLLSDDGVIFISIDDNEVNNLKNICNEVFGTENFIADLIWRKKTGASDAKGFSVITEYILVYCKSTINIEKIFTKDRNAHDVNRYKLSDKYVERRGKHYIDNLDRGGIHYSDSLNYPIQCPDGSITYPNGRTEFENDGWTWTWGKEKLEWGIKNGFIEFRKSINKKSGWAVCYKNYLNVNNKDELVERGAPHKNMIMDILNTSATIEIKKIFNSKVFQYTKPVSLIQLLLSFVELKDNDIILDFFSGSSTTAHAVMKHNVNDNYKCKFIMIQLPEIADKKSEAFKVGYKNICEIGRARIDKAGEKIKEENKDKECIENLDIGFKVFRVSDTNIRWNYENEDLRTLSKISVNSDEEQTSFDYIAATKMDVDLDEEISSKDILDFMPGTKDIDVVYEILLRQRDIPLSAKVELLKDIGKRTYIFADSYVVCLETEITEELIEKLAAINPLPIKYILRDSAFGDDIELKDLSYRRLQALIERNTGESKKTYTVEFI